MMIGVFEYSSLAVHSLSAPKSGTVMLSIA